MNCIIFDLLLKENDYSGGIFVPMYDQSGQVPVSTQQTDQNATSTDYRRNCGVPLAFFEPPSTGNYTQSDICNVNLKTFLFLTE